MHVLFPGSFDPVTRGHLDLIIRAAATFDFVTVGVFVSEKKAGLFPPDARAEMLRRAVADLPNVSVDTDGGMVYDYCRTHGIDALLRGVRGNDDLPYETEAAAFNRAHGVETVFLLTSPEYAGVSSTLVREILHRGEMPEALVPEAILPILREKCQIAR